MSKIFMSGVDRGEGWVDPTIIEESTMEENAEETLAEYDELNEEIPEDDEELNEEEMQQVETVIQEIISTNGDDLIAQTNELLSNVDFNSSDAAWEAPSLEEDATIRELLEMADTEHLEEDEELVDVQPTFDEDETVDELEINVEIPGTASDENSREALINEIRNFYQLLDMDLIEKNIEAMDDISLLDHVRLLRINNGGSFNMAAVIQRAEVEYLEYVNSDLMKMRMNLITTKGTDFIALAQKVRSLIGNDFSISQTRSLDYFNMLKSATSTISVIHDKITAIASALGLSFTHTSFNPRGDIIPIIEGMPADPRIAIAVLNALIAHLDKFADMQRNNMAQLERNRLRIATLEDSNKLHGKRAEEAQEHAVRITKEFERYTTQNCYWVIRDTRKGGIVRKINENDQVRSSDQLDLRGNIVTGMQFPSKTAARTWANRLMLTDRFKKRILEVKRISIVDEE